MKSNDGTNIPSSNFVKSAKMTGALNPADSLDNSMAFETGAGGINGKIRGMESLMKNENLDDPGFDASGSCFYKFGIPYGESALFNQLPPGPDISDQKMALINEMPMKTVTMIGYPGDGAFPVRDVAE